MEKKELDIQETSKNLSREESEEDVSYRVNLKKGSPLNPDIKNVALTQLPDSEIDEINKNEFVQMFFEARPRPNEPYEGIAKQFKDEAIVAASIQADGTTLMQLSSGLKEIIKRCNIEDVEVVEVPAKVVLMRKDYTISIPEDCIPGDPNSKPHYYL